ncbi:MAG: sensor histidine kinase [Candidatus Poseidoniales archaeon]
MLEGEESINRLTCTFNNDNLEKEYKKVKLEKNRNYIWNLMLLGHLIFLLVILDDLKQLGIQPIYVLVHAIASVTVYFLLLSEKYREQYYEHYFTFVIPALMANGAYHYSMDKEAFFGPGEAALPLLTLLFFTIYPVNFLNSFFIVTTTVVGFLIYLLEMEIITGSQIPYLLIMPFVYSVFVKRSNEYKDRIDYVKTEELKILREQAQNASKAKSDFLANMSHELRTPLNAILGYSEMLMEEAEDDELESYAADLAKIQSSGEHLLTLINDILDLSKIEAGKMDLHIEEFEFVKHLAQIEATAKPLVEKNGNKFILENNATFEKLKNDQTKLRQILFNMLSNAAKFTKEGSVTLSINTIEKDVRFAVTDTGIGMNEKQLGKVFDEFTQAEASTAKDYGGTGLGLPISKKMTEMMGGKMEVESEEGKGTTFSITIPVEVKEEK